MEFYTKKSLLEELKKAHDKYPSLQIGYSYMSLMSYEKKGIVDKPQTVLVCGKDWRFYTKEDMATAVDRVVEYKRTLNK